MEKETFFNEIDNKIIVKIKKLNGIGTNFKTKENLKYNGLCINLIGPTSEFTNEITIIEAVKIYNNLGKFLKKNKYI
jgi:hypothetical protein